MNPNEIKELPPVRRNTVAEMREVLDAIEAGKPIQYKCVSGGEAGVWQDTAEVAPNFRYNAYRVKPEEPTKHWRPFDGIAECHDAIDQHGAWVINIHNHQHCQIVAYDKAGALVAQTTKTYKELLENFIFVNGFPCGEEE